jgi:DNA-binding MarR family transcriptional regulator
MRLKITEKGKEAFNNIRDLAEYDRYGLTQDEWMYLGYLMKESPDTSRIVTEYGTTGTRIFNKFVRKGYAKEV